MKNVYIYCEGQTEESFVNQILYPYFFQRDIVVYPIICATKTTSSEKYRGGVVRYGKIKRELSLICKSHPNEFVTTMFDYYGLPKDTPGMVERHGDIFAFVEQIEQRVNEDIGRPNCRFHLMLHEFEGILFSRPESFARIADEQVVESIRRIRNSFPTPEHINSSPETAPSKRLKQLIPNYAKIRNGTLLSDDMGVDTIMAECLHFRQWVSEIAELA